MKFLTALLVVVLVAVSCGETVPPPQTEVLTVFVVGGWSPPWGLVVYGDGTAVKYSPADRGRRDIVGVGAIEPGLVKELWDEVRRTDMEALRERLGPGSRRSIVDGVDTHLTITVGEDSWSFSSTDVELDRDEPVFALVGQIMGRASSAIDRTTDPD